MDWLARHTALTCDLPVVHDLHMPQLLRIWQQSNPLPWETRMPSQVYCHQQKRGLTEFYLSIQVCAYNVFQNPAAYKGTWHLKSSPFSFEFGQICAFNLVQDIVNTWKSGVIHEVQGRVFKQLFSYIKKLKCSKWLWITKSMLQSAIIFRLLQAASE